MTMRMRIMIMMKKVITKKIPVVKKGSCSLVRSISDSVAVLLLAATTGTTVQQMNNNNNNIITIVHSFQLFPSSSSSSCSCSSSSHLLTNNNNNNQKRNQSSFVRLYSSGSNMNDESKNEDVPRTPATMQMIDGCTGGDYMTDDMVAAMMETENVLYHPATPYKPNLASFMYRKNHTYYCMQCTLQKIHLAKPEQIYQIVKRICTTKYPYLQKPSNTFIPLQYAKCGRSTT